MVYNFLYNKVIKKYEKINNLGNNYSYSAN